MVVNFCPLTKFKEGISFVCIHCRHQCSIYIESIFFKRKIGPKTFKLMLSLWCNSFYAKNCSWIVQQATLTLHNSTFYRYYSWFRFLLSIYMKNYMLLVEWDGDDDVFEIDKMYLGAKKRGKHGRRPAMNQLVFGIYLTY